jgi:hypothetical protein
MTDENSDLQAQLTALQGRVSALEGHVTSLQSEIATLQGKKAGADTDADDEDIPFPVAGAG